MKQFLGKIKILDATTLKIIAIISMTIDHTGLIFFHNNYFMRSIGRIAMPIFSFFISEGYIKTKNRKKYLTRLGVFALISEIPFDLAFFGRINPGYQNIMFTFFISVLALMTFDLICGKPEKTETVYKVPRTLLGIIAAGSIGTVSVLLRTDYGIVAVLCVLIFYLFRNSKQWIRSLSGTAFLTVTNPKSFSVYAGLGFIPLLLYNGKKGKGLKWLFYIFYPGHLLILFLIKNIFF